MRLISRNAPKVKLVFHTRSDCPKKSTLLIPEAEARALVMEFGKKVFGEDKTIIVVREKGPLSRLLIRIEKTISRRRFK